LKKTNKKPPKIKIAFIHEDVGHLTGGRYYAWFLASALTKLDYDVTIYTNKIPVFDSDFVNYPKPKVEVITGAAHLLDNIRVKADIYFGSPIHGAVAASSLGRRYNKPAYALIFDPFPMMEKYLGKRMYIGWEQLLKNLKKSNTNIISLCYATTQYIHKWLQKKHNQVISIYPCVNSIVLNSKKRTQNKKNYVVFISRLVKHKRFEDVVYAVSRTGMNLKVISSVNAVKASAVVKQYCMSKKTEFHLKCNDDEKFDIISNSSGVINGSIFEGFGMYVAEAIACGVPFVGYDYPTFREIRDYSGVDNIYLAERENRSDLVSKLRLMLKQKIFYEPSHLFDFEVMIERLKEIL
jgi:glycosyltransferase involved in cell wall biosynthesis